MYGQSVRPPESVAVCVPSASNGTGAGSAVCLEGCGVGSQVPSQELGSLGIGAVIIHVGSTARPPADGTRCGCSPPSGVFVAAPKFSRAPVRRIWELCKTPRLRRQRDTAPQVWQLLDQMCCELQHLGSNTFSEDQMCCKL